MKIQEVVQVFEAQRRLERFAEMLVEKIAEEQVYSDQEEFENGVELEVHFKRFDLDNARLNSLKVLEAEEMVELSLEDSFAEEFDLDRFAELKIPFRVWEEYSEKSLD